MTLQKFLITPLKPIVFAPLLAIYTTAWLMPATFWYEPISLTIAQDEPGQPIQVVLQRHIHWSFHGYYVVAVRDVETNQLACDGASYVPYKGGLVGSFNRDLVEFAADDTRCAALPDGAYYAEACWTVLYPLWGILPEKTVCMTSNPFGVQRQKVET